MQNKKWRKKQMNTKLKICKDTKNTKIKDYEEEKKQKTQEGQNPHSQSLQMHFRKSLRCNNDNNNNEVCDPPVLKLKLFTFLKGINLTPQPTVCFNQVLAWVLIRLELCCLTGLSQYQGGNVYYINGVKCHEINVRSLSEQCKLWLVVGCN